MDSRTPPSKPAKDLKPDRREETLARITLTLQGTSRLELAPDEGSGGFNPYDTHRQKVPRRPDIWGKRAR